MQQRSTAPPCSAPWSPCYGAGNYGFLEAGAVIAMVPCVVLYIALQRFYLRGLMSGVVKG